MTFSFNLIDQKWLPCLYVDEALPRLVSLKQALTEAPRIRELVSDSPLETAALHRMLLALLHRVFGPKSYEAWGALWQDGQGSWDRPELHAYLEEWYDHFDLFHEQYPFYQAVNEAKTQPATKLIQELSAGNNPTLFDHHTDENSVILTRSRAARALIATQSFGLSMAGGYRAGSCAGHIIFLIRGNSLFETLMLNLIRYPENRHQANKDDRPVWEMENPFMSSKKRPYGLLDYYTWLSRHIRLCPEVIEDQVMVKEIMMKPGLTLPDHITKISTYDPLKHYSIVIKGKRTKKQEISPMRFHRDRAIWRDSAALFTLHQERQTTDNDRLQHPPRSFAWLSNLIRDYRLNESEGQFYKYQYMAFGLAADKANLEFCRYEHMSIPAAYLKNDEWVASLTSNLGMAESVRGSLWWATTEMAKQFLYPNKTSLDDAARKTVNALIDTHWATERHYWANLEPHFYDLLDGLLKDQATAQKVWWNVLRKQAEAAFAKPEAALGQDARAMRAIALGQQQLDMKLGYLHNQYFPKKKGDVSDESTQTT